MLKDAQILYNYCTGCGLCKSIDNIELKTDKKGYYHPELISETQINLCKSICPCFQNQREDDDIWGHAESICAGWSSDDYIRRVASSGGIITSCLCLLLRENLIDAVIHIGASKDVPWETTQYVSKTEKEVCDNCGSRYAISHTLEHIDELLAEDLRYAVVGRPCEIYSLNQYILSHPERGNQIIYKFSFFCGGIPSKIANERMLEELSCNKEDVVKVKYRGDGWPGKYCCSTIDGEKHTMSYIDSWGKVLGRDIAPICRLCSDGLGAYADISCGDAWYLENEKPTFVEDLGRNVIISRTSKGNEILQMAIRKGVIEVEEYDKSQLAFAQRSQLERKSTMLAKILAFKLMGKVTPQYNVKSMLQWAKYGNIRLQLRIFKGTLKRIKTKKV